MTTRMQQRRGTAAEWTSADPILAEGEIGFETDTGQFKIGDGASTWSDLNYFKDIVDLGGNLDDYIPLTQRGTAEGVATLDVDGQVPLSQLGNAPATDLTGYATETYVDTAISNLVDSAPGALDTLNELAAALGDDANYAATMTSALGNKQDIVSGVSDTQIGYLSNVTSDIQTQLDNKLESSDISGLATETYADNAASTAETNANNYTDNVVGGLSGNATAVVNGNLDVLTGTGITVNNNAIEVDFQELNTHYDAYGAASTAYTNATLYTDNAISAIPPVDLSGKQDVVTGVTSTEIGYLDGVTSSIQTQLNTKAPTADPTFTGTMVLPSTVNGPSISTSVNLLFPTQGGHITLGGSQTTGSLTLGGGANRTTGAINIGTGATTAGTKTINVGTGSTGGTTAITLGSSSGATSNIVLNGNVTLPSTTSIGNVSATELGYLDGVTSSIQTQLDSKASTTYVDNAVSDLIAAAPGALDTLNELAAAIGDDANFAATIATQLGQKADSNSPTFTGLTDFQGIVDFSDAAVIGIDSLPTQTGNAGKYLSTDGTTASWQEAAATTQTPHPFAMIG